MRSFSRLLLMASLGAVTTASSAFAFVTLGHGRLVGNATARVDYDSNIFVNNTEEDDYIGTATGEVRYIRDASIVTFEAAAGLSVLRFQDHDDQNGVDPYLSSRLGYDPSDKTKLRASLDVRRNSAANEFVNDRTQSNDYHFDASFEHLTTDKLGFRLTGGYSWSDQRTAGYSSTESASFGLYGVHKYSEKLKLLAGVTVSDVGTDSAVVGRQSVDGMDWRYNVAAEGELAPKVTGEVAVGWVERNLNGPGFGNADAVYVSSRVTWLAAEKTTFSLSASQDFGLSAADQSVKTSTITVSLNQSFSEKISFEGSVGADRSTYTGAAIATNRKDDGFIIRGRLAYILTDTVSVDLAAGYRNNDSNLAVSTYDRYNVGAGVSIRF